MELVPIGKVLVVNWACPPLMTAVPNELTPLKNCTVPVGGEGGGGKPDPVTFAIKVTDVPNAGRDCVLLSWMLET